MVKVVNKRLRSLNEVYFSNVKPYELSQIEDWFGELKQYGSLIEIEEDSRFKYSIPAYLCKLFGFNAVTMHLLPKQSINACVALNFLKGLPEKVALQWSRERGFSYLLKRHNSRNNVVEIEHGLKINREVCPLDIIIYINFGAIYQCTAKELVALLLHEIGHQFHDFFVDLNQEVVTRRGYERATEHFADIFAAMYGYSKELSGFLAKSSRTEFEGVVPNKFEYENYEYSAHQSPHPSSKGRINMINQQLQYDVDHQILSAQDKLKLKKEIKTNKYRSQMNYITKDPHVADLVRYCNNISNEVSNRAGVSNLITPKKIDDLISDPKMHRIPTKDYSYTVTKPSGDTEQYVTIKPHMSTPLKDLHYNTSANQFSFDAKDHLYQTNYPSMGDIFRTDGSRVQQDPSTGVYPDVTIRDFQPPYYERVRPGDSRQQGIIRRPSADPRFK